MSISTTTRRKNSRPRRTCCTGCIADSYLIGVGHAELLAGLFGELLIPPGVAVELADKGAPHAVREWIGQPPAWLRIRPLHSPPDAELMAALDPGEREAIQLTTEQKADVLIMDERRGRAIAQRRGLPLTGALGVLGDAYQRALRFEALLVTRYAR
jgi:predicted nucleic acid-binding protein